MPRRDEGATGLTQRNRVKTDLFLATDGSLVDASGNVVGLTGAQVAATQALVSKAGNVDAILAGGRAISPYCVFCIPTLQAVGSGSAKDVSGNSNHLALGSGIVDGSSAGNVWADTALQLMNARANVPDTAATAGGYLYMPSLGSVWSTDEWFIFSALIQPTVAPQARNLISCTTSAATTGWYLKGNASGKLYLVLKDAAGTAGVNVASTPTLLTSGRSVHITVAVDPVTRDAFLYVNGVLADQWLASWSALGAGVSDQYLTLAHYGTTVNNAALAAYGCLWAGMQYYKGPGALPAHHAAIARRLAAAALQPLGYFDI